MIRRSALVAKLDWAARLKLTMVVAPAGYGKTVLLRQWREQLTSNRTVVFLSLEPADMDTERFSARVLAALRECGHFSPTNAARPDADQGLMPARGGAAHRSSAELLSRTLSQTHSDLTLVLDHAHVLNAGSTLQLIEHLLSIQAPSLQWIVACQRSDPINTSRFRITGQLSILGPQDLAFDKPEIQRLARNTSGRSLSKSELETIEQATEGWPVGVALSLAGAAQEGRRSESRMAPPNGARTDLFDYFETTVWNHLGTQLQEFLLGSAVVEPMNADLCNALLSITDSQPILESLHRSQVFIVALDNYSNQFRYHVLFRQFLQRRLRADPVRLASLEQRASRWYASQHHHALALAHAFAGSDIAWQCDVLCRCAGSLRDAGEFELLVNCWEKLSKTDAVIVEAIAAPAIFALLILRRFEDAANALAQFDPGRGDRVMHPNRRLMLRTMMQLLSGGDSVDDSLLIGTEQRAGLDAFESGWVLVLNAHNQMRRFNFGSAWRLAMRARDALERTGIFGHGYADITAMLAERAQCDFRFASERCNALYLSVCNGPKNAAWVNALTALAQLRYDEDRLLQAESLLVAVLPKLNSGASIEHVVTVYDTLSRVYSVSERHAEAMRLQNHLQSMLDCESHRRFLAQLCCERMRHSLAQNELRESRDIVREFGLDHKAESGEWASPRAYEEAWERFGYAYAQFLVKTGDYAAAAGILSNLRQSAMEAKYSYRVMILEAALSGCLWQAGEQEAAFQALNRGLGCSGWLGYPRTAFDDVANLCAILTAAIEKSRIERPLPSKYIRKFESTFKSQSKRGKSVADRPAFVQIDPLTESEIRTLRMLAKGLSNQEISARSRIAVSTVKWHVKNLFSKLDVTTRAAAIARAKENRIID